MELRQLRYFVETAERLNFTEASRALYITQSTLSQQIKQLEQELGVPLFDRVSKRVYLTEAGSEFLPYARRTLHDTENGTQRLRDLQDVRTGELNIGVIYSLIAFLPRVVAAFSRSYPEVKINIAYHQTNNLYTMLRERRFDFALCYQSYEADDTFEVERLFDTPLSVVMSRHHPLSARKRIPLSLLREFPLVLPTSTFYARSVLDHLCQEQCVTLHPQVEMNGVSLLQELVRDGHWVTVLSGATIADQPELRAVPLAGNVQMQASIVSLRDTYQKNSVREFWNILRRSLPQSQA